MKPIQVRLLGGFDLSVSNVSLTERMPKRAQQTLAYLLLRWGKPVQREHLASAIWGGHYDTAQSKAYLRKALWQLQSVWREAVGASHEELINSSNGSVQLHREAPVLADVSRLMQCSRMPSGNDRVVLSDAEFESVEGAVNLYQGDLLEGWYEDWIPEERRRVRRQFIDLVDLLMRHCKQAGRFQQGLTYGVHALKFDAANERAYCRLMELSYLAGDRTGALRFFQLCEKALREELDVAPTGATIRLYQQIRNGSLGDLPAAVVSSTLVESAERYPHPADHAQLASIRADLLSLKEKLIGALEQVESMMVQHKYANPSWFDDQTDHEERINRDTERDTASA